MKKIILLLFTPLFFHAQKPNRQAALEKSEPAPLVKSDLIDTPRESARKKIESYRQMVVSGTSMSVVAALYSEDPGSAKNGGRYEAVQKGQMVKEFDEVAFSLKPGEVSQVFETQYGFHFIELIDQKNDVLDLRHILVTIK